jgi:hypothetical protein
LSAPDKIKPTFNPVFGERSTPELHTALVPCLIHDLFGDVEEASVDIQSDDRTLWPESTAKEL